MKNMDLTDWLLAAGFVILFAVAFGLLLPPYGYPAGALLGAFLIYRAKRRRDELKERGDKDR